MYEINRFDSKDFSDRYVADFERLFKELSGKEFRFSPSVINKIFSDPNLLHFVAKGDDSQIVGYCCVVVMNLLQGTRYHIESVVVDQDWRKHGIGFSMLSNVLDYLNNIGASHVNLTCNPNRKDAIKLYEKMGFSRPNTDVYRYHF